MSFAFARPPVVVDASVAIEFIVDQDGQQVAWDEWIETERMRLAPAHFWLETANGLVKGLRVGAGDAIAMLDLLRGLGLESSDRGIAGLERAMHLAERHGLSVYDALYLDLAIDTDASLATYDRALARAAQAENVPVEPLAS